MSQCLIALGSNLGDRQGTLEAALEAINRLSSAQVLKVSRWYETQPVGGPIGQPLFLNGVALIDTTLDPRALSVGLRCIEEQAGRTRRERWAARSLDVDLLLVGDVILRTPDLEVPHPRMSFRQFVLEPAVEIAPDFVHPVLGGTLRELLDQLNFGADVCAVLALRESDRQWLVNQIIAFAPGAAVNTNAISPDEARWPNEMTSFVEMNTRHREELTAHFPKLNVVLAETGTVADQTMGEVSREKFAAAIDAKGRGPTLALRNVDPKMVQTELKAALEAVWPAP